MKLRPSMKESVALPTKKASRGVKKSSKKSVKVTRDVKDTARPKSPRVNYRQLRGK